MIFTKKHGSLPLRDFSTRETCSSTSFTTGIFRGVRVVKPLDYVPYVKKDAVKLLRDEYGWQEYPQKHFESRFTKFYESYWQPEKIWY